MEIWKKIEGYENYEVSNEGRVRSLGNGVSHNSKKRVMKLKKNNGYMTVGLYNDGKQKWFKVHRLVCVAFIPNPDNLPCVNHINEDKTDNRVENLEWCSVKYNTNFGTGIHRMVEKVSKPILQFSKDGEFIREWPSASEVQRILGFFQSSIQRCCTRKRKIAYNFIWRYK